MRPITFLLAILLPFGVGAQTASDFTITDIDGNSRNLFSELNANNVVVLKFFTNWCSICNNTADDVVDIYNGHETAGNPVVFWALDRDPNETNAHATTYRNNHSIPFPVIGEAYSVAQQFGVMYQPEYYIIRPDRSYVMEVSFSTMAQQVQNALSSLTGVDELSEQANVKVAGRGITWNATEAGQAILRIMDVSGRIVMERGLVSGETADLNLKNGAYLYSLSMDHDVLVAGKMLLMD